MINGLSMREQALLKKAEEDAELLRPHAFAATGERFMREETLAILRKWFGLLVPTQYGGLGVSSQCYGTVLATLAKGDSSAALWLAMHCFAMSEANRPEVNATTRRRIFELGLQHPFSAGISEPPSTGHLPSTFTPKDVTARKLSGGRWVINGPKKVVTGYRYSEYMMVFARLEGSDNITVCLAVPTGSTGMSEGREWDRVDFFQTTRSNSVTFKDVKVGPEALVFETDAFLPKAVAFYGIRTFSYMAVYLGIFERALKLATQMVMKRVPGGLTQSVSYEPSVSENIGEGDVLLRSAQLLLQDASQTFDRQRREEPTAAAPSMLRAKVAIGKLARWMPLLNEQVGLSGMGGDPEYRQCTKDLAVAGLMPPTSAVSARYLGYLLMGQSLEDMPTIR